MYVDSLLCQSLHSIEYSVMERVTALGWADELSKMDSPDLFKDDPYIQRFCQKDITGRGNFFQFTPCYILSQDYKVLQVDDFINTFMEYQKAKRLRQERDTLLAERLPILRKVYNTCVKTYPVNSIIPCVADVFLDPVVRDLFIRPSLSTTDTEMDLETVGAIFPDIVLRWRIKTEEKLLNMISPSQNIDAPLLQLATTIFSCRFCPNEPLTYPRILIHQCANATYNGIMIDKDKDLSMLRSFLGHSYWNASNFIIFDEQKIVSLSEAIKLCGLDPKSATREDMDKQNPIFECLTCSDLRKGRCTLSWLGLVCFFFN